MDAIPFIFEHTSYEDEPLADDYTEHEPTDHDYLNHTLTVDQPETYDLIFQFRELLDSYKLLDGYTRYQDSYLPSSNSILDTYLIILDT